jgi:GT2 family glycosyltransferase
VRVAVLITCHNRKHITVASLQILFSALAGVEHVAPEFYLVDDGSTDGTGQEVEKRFPSVSVAYGDGTLYWNGGMCRAFEEARHKGTFEAYLLFNDDVMVDPVAIVKFFEEYIALNASIQSILVGATIGKGNLITYSGLKRISRWRPLSVARISPIGCPQRCDTFNGNFVLVPGQFFEKIGGLDAHFRHAYGDIDLGYRATKYGVAAWLASDPIGYCEAAPAAPLALTKKECRRRRFNNRWQKKDSLSQRIHFTLRHAKVPAACVLIIGVVFFSMLHFVYRRFDKDW